MEAGRAAEHLVELRAQRNTDKVNIERGVDARVPCRDGRAADHNQSDPALGKGALEARGGLEEAIRLARQPVEAGRQLGSPAGSVTDRLYQLRSLTQPLQQLRLLR